MKIGPIHWRRFEKFLLLSGCLFVGEEGDHRKYNKKGIVRPIIIPRYAELPVFIILNNLKTLGISRKEYLKILQEKL